MRLSKYKNLVLATSTKKDGNMSFLIGDQKNTLKNRENFLKSLNLSLDQVVVAKVVHRASVFEAGQSDMGKGSRENSEVIESDALVTRRKGIFLALLTADCLPIALYDPKNEAIALVHASRHNIEEIIPETIRNLIGQYGTNPENLTSEIGPSIGPCHHQLDLWERARSLLEKSGVASQNVFNQKICTYHSSHYYSHRKFVQKNLNKDNRLITVFGMK